jgi:hypothetical protein
MDSANVNPNVAPDPAPAPVRDGMARAAVGLSIFAFLLPLGIAAVVLGHMAEQRISSSAGRLNGKYLARAALWIAYIQMALVSLVLVTTWGLVRETAQGFQRDPLVQRLIRSSDAMQPLDPQSALEAEAAAQRIVYQFLAIQDQIRRRSDKSLYACRIGELIDTGMDGTTDAEKRAFGVRILESPYMYGISKCNPPGDGGPLQQYVLTAVPRSPRMPDGSAIFCADQSGAVRRLRGDGISLDCLDHGSPVN